MIPYRPLLIFLLCLGTLLPPTSSRACPAGYESLIALLGKACLILEVEALSVRDAPAPKLENKDKHRGLLNSRPFSSDPEYRKNAIARVKVTKVIKGKCQLREFDLIGGPYYSCAPMALYRTFEKGGKYYLVLAQNLPKEAKSLTITWRNRVIYADENTDINKLQDTAKQSWQLRMATTIKALKEHQSRAEEIHQQWTQDAQIDLKQEDYGVLYLLKIMFQNPDRLIPHPCKLDSNQNVDSITSSNHLIPKSLQEEIERRVKQQPDIVKTLHLSLFKTYLTNRLLLPEAMAARAVNHLGPRDKHWLVTSDYLPSKTNMSRSWEEGSEMEAIWYLMTLEPYEDDLSVWRCFALSERKLKPEVFSNWFKQNSHRDFSNWGKIQLLLNIRIKATIPIVERLMEQENNSSRLARYCDYFLTMQQFPQALKAMDRYTERAISYSKYATDDERKKNEKEWISREIDSFEKLLETHNVKDPRFANKIQQMKKKRAAMK